MDPSRPPREWTDDEKILWMEENKKIILSAVQSYRIAYEIDDLQQMAAEATLKAFENFDPKRGVKLSTYVYRAIKNEINMQIRSDKAQKRSAVVVPFSSTETMDGQSSLGYENVDTSQTDWLHQPQMAVDKRLEYQEAIKYLRQLIEVKLSRQEREVLLRMLNGETQVSIAKLMGCSQAKISNMYKMIRAKLIYEMLRAGFDFLL